MDTDIEILSQMTFTRDSRGILRSDHGFTRRTMEDTIFRAEIDGNVVRFIPYVGTRRSIETFQLVPVRNQR